MHVATSEWNASSSFNDYMDSMEVDDLISDCAFGDDDADG